VFGPVFATPSKPNFVAGIAQLEQVVELGIAVLALGGVDGKNAQACINAGACGVACIRSVMSATKIAETVSALLAFVDGIQT
jgi:thiamine-phosphate pyrophosphorylase